MSEGICHLTPCGNADILQNESGIFTLAEACRPPQVSWEEHSELPWQPASQQISRCNSRLTGRVA